MEAIVSRPSSCFCLVSSYESMAEAILNFRGFSDSTGWGRGATQGSSKATGNHNLEVNFPNQRSRIPTAGSTLESIGTSWVLCSFSARSKCHPSAKI